MDIEEEIGNIEKAINEKLRTAHEVKCIIKAIKDINLIRFVVKDEINKWDRNVYFEYAYAPIELVDKLNESIEPIKIKAKQDLKKLLDEKLGIVS